LLVFSLALILIGGSGDSLVSLATLLLILGLAFLLGCLPGNLGLDIPAFLSGGWETLPGTAAFTLFIIGELGDGGKFVLANLVRNIITNLAGSVEVIADLLADWSTDLSAVGGALALNNVPGLDPGNKVTHLPLPLLAVLLGNILAGLSGEHLAVNLGHLGTLEVGDINTLLLGEGATLSLSSLRALGPGGGGTFLFVNSLTFLLRNITTLLSGNITAFLLRNITTLFLGNLATLLINHISALLGIVNLLTDLSGHR